MCGRASLAVTETELERRFSSRFYTEIQERYHPLPNFNMAPSQLLPVITNTDPDRIQLFRWGLIPSWARDEKIGNRMINARSETVCEKPAFRQAFEQRRCLWPVDGYYEWIRNGKGRIPYRITLADSSVFAIAGLWEVWKNGEGEEVLSFTILTRAAGATMEFLHPRMPVILSPEWEDRWLSDSEDPGKILAQIPEFGKNRLRIYRVSSRVNNVLKNDPKLIEEVEDSIQGTLF